MKNYTAVLCPPQFYVAAKPKRLRMTTSVINYVAHIQNIFNLKGYQSRMIGSQVRAIFLKGWILPIGGVVSEGSGPAPWGAGLF